MKRALKLSFSISLLLLTACASDQPQMGERLDKQDEQGYGAILVAVACPTFYNWIDHENIKSENEYRSAIAEAEAYLDCEGPQSLNRRTEARFIPLPAGNYFLVQKEGSHLFQLTYKQSAAFSFKVRPNTITYIGNINITVVPTTEDPEKLELSVAVHGDFFADVSTAHLHSPSFQKGFLHKEMLWRPVITAKFVDKNLESGKKHSRWVTDTSPDGFF